MHLKPYLILVIILILTACGKSTDKYCDELEVKFSDPDLQNYLVSWVDENIVGQSFSEEEIWPSGGIFPGYYWIPEAEVDWAKFDFWEQSQVRFITDSYVVSIEGLAVEATSIFFAERSRKGIMVRMPHSDSFGVNEAELKLLSDRVAIYCMQ